MCIWDDARLNSARPSRACLHVCAQLPPLTLVGAPHAVDSSPSSARLAGCTVFLAGQHQGSLGKPGQQGAQPSGREHGLGTANFSVIPGTPQGIFGTWNCYGHEELIHAVLPHTTTTCQLTTIGPSHHDLQTGSDEGQPAGSPPPGSCKACAARFCGSRLAEGVVRAHHHRRRQGRLPRRQRPDHPPRRRREGRHQIRAAARPDGRPGGVRLQGRFPHANNRADAAPSSLAQPGNR